MDLGLSGLKAIVTGGSKGIGRAVAETLSREGATVAICARSASGVEAAVEAMRGAGGNVIGEAVDVADATRLQAWVERSADAMGGLDIVICNVSAMSPDNTPESWDLTYQVDLMHSVRVVQAALPMLEASKAASIVIISSVSGREVDITAGGPYGPFKAALAHYAQGLAFQLAAKGIRANAVSPGDTFVAGGFWDNIKRDEPELFAESLALNPSGRMAEPQEIANGIAFIASPAASFVSGTNLVIDGALTHGVQL